MSYLEKDLEIIKNSEFAEKLRGAKILVTGATGLIGSLLVRSFLRIKSEIYIVVRNIEKAKIIYGSDINKIHVLIGDITSLSWQKEIETTIDYVFHCAAVTSSKVMVSKPVETIKTAIDGTENILLFSDQHKVRTFVFVSSMEVYGTLAQGEIATEDKLGFIDISKIRSDYPESKRMCENLCIAYSAEKGIDVRIARLAQTFGPGILPWERRVFAQFAQSVINGTDIVLHTRGLSEGNYCYSRDMVLGLFTILFKGNNREAYNVVNVENHMTIADMAHLVANEVAGGRIKVVYDISDDNKYGYAADTHLKLSGNKLEGLGWKPEVQLKDMYNRMIYDMKAND